MRDLRDAMRALRASPSFTLVALVILALATGAGTAIYSVVDAVVFRGLPFDHADRLVAINGTGRGQLIGDAPLDFLIWRADPSVFEAVAASYWPSSVALDTPNRQTRRLRVTHVSADLFRVLGVHPQIGQIFSRDNETEADHHVVLLSDAMWREQFAGDPAVIGQELHLEDGVWQILGVMSPGFTYPLDVAPMDLWMPAIMGERERLSNRLQNSSVRVVARLKPTVSLAQAQSRVAQLSGVEARAHPNWFRNRGNDVVLPLKDAIVGPPVRRWMLVFLGAVGCVLLIACVNLANLFLARAMVRVRDLGIRTALGATRWQLARSLLVESLLLATLGTGFGALIAYMGVDALKAALPPGLFRADLIAVNLRVLGASACAAIATGVAIGVVPALASTRTQVTDALREGGRGGTTSVVRQRLRTGLVLAELTLAVPLVVGAGLFIVSFARLMAIDIGVDYHHVLTVEVTPKVTLDRSHHPPEDALSALTIPDDQARAAADLTEMAARARAIPGVLSAAAIENGVPLSGEEFRDAIVVPGRVTDEPFEAITVYHVTRDYPTAMRLPLLRGRVFNAAEDRSGGAPVVLLNAAAVTQFFSGRDALGATVGLQGSRTVVGIVGNTRIDGPEGDVKPEAYLPMAQTGIRSGYLLVRTDEPPTALSTPLATIVSAVAPDAKEGALQSLDETFSHLVAERRLSMLLFGMFGVLALAIATVGIYGVVSYLVEQRTKEIGVRMALGATPRRILQQVLGHSAWVIGIGVSFGTGVAWMLARFVTAFLFQVPAHAVVLYVAVSSVIVLSGLLATWLPAQRAAKVDPLVALRVE
jgi:putative ABC transport system permease protein